MEEGKTYFSDDECASYHGNRAKEVYFWRKDNPYYYEEIEQHPPRISRFNRVT
jgi:hypothetical protein